MTDEPMNRVDWLHAIQGNLAEIVDLLGEINSKLGAGFGSLPRAERDDVILRVDSVEVEDNSRGTTAKAKAFAPTMQEAEDEAIASIQRIRARLGTISQRQAAAEDLARALAKLLVALDPVLEQVPEGAVRTAYEALAKAGYEA